MSYGERWMQDGLQVCEVPAYAITIDADMTQAREVIEAAKQNGIHLTYTHIFVRATALVLKRSPELNQMACGGRVYSPTQVDIALSIAGKGAIAPLMRLDRADAKTVVEIAEEIRRRAPQVRARDEELRKALDRWGFLIPFGFLRRAVLRTLFRSVKFRHEGAGTFQVSVLAGVDQASSPVFSTSAMLVAADVRDKAVVVNGELKVRLMVTLTCCADHRHWDGRAGQKFLSAVKDTLESDELLQEISKDLVMIETRCRS